MKDLVNGFERSLTFRPAFDRRSPEPSKNYGVGAVMLRFVLIGKRGAVQFVMSSGWYLSHVADEWRGPAQTLLKPQGFDLGYHSYVPMYEGQSKYGSCEYLDGCDCYYDGSALRAEKVMDVFLKDGEDAVWKALEDEYKSRFGDDQANAFPCRECGKVWSEESGATVGFLCEDCITEGFDPDVVAVPSSGG